MSAALVPVEVTLEEPSTGTIELNHRKVGVIISSLHVPYE